MVWFTKIKGGVIEIYLEAKAEKGKKAIHSFGYCYVRKQCAGYRQFEKIE